ncbi:RNA 2',3'-cyclic phosphodiesterase [Pseudoduganella albidiflava]|uniref:RNA 2',3'-cyclic phosphodiesterase n=1 Tax=Pseudoduganella albidiflava TaxID=321983 RepID=A0A411WSF3_9BURK|nr:RNA 2',3'-cyclic phosphodiesterase [Pseudoduganella albidiflava]QBH99603.1 RNA 2',3'-cyclic phosphodiesterase [Pseudoduganella albidiflava]GGY46112.1 RNA 2',3'-cyclic phosphodiesterase [Pseudoduganella albidiflava]
MIANEPEGRPNAGTTRKLFFALWPDEAARAALTALQAPVAGRRTPPAKLHLTLAFLGQVPADAVPALLAIRDRLAVPPLRLVIDCYGYFARPRIAWAGMTQVPAALVALHEELVRELEAAGFSAATHGAFKPHVTLAREAKQAPPEVPAAPVEWTVDRAVLVESLPDGRYVPLERQPVSAITPAGPLADPPAPLLPPAS